MRRVFLQASSYFAARRNVAAFVGNVAQMRHRSKMEEMYGKT
jgi:hypothetical protein